MKILTIDTSTSVCSLALSDGDRLLAEYQASQDQRLSSRLVEYVNLILGGQGLSVRDLEGFGAVVGPGAFTGLRVGLSTIKGLAYAAGKEIAGISSLSMLAMNLPLAPHPVCPMLDARKDEVYTGLYRCDGLPRTILPDRVVAPGPFLDSLDGPIIFLGEGAVRYRGLIESKLRENAVFLPFHLNVPRAGAAAPLVLDLFRRGKTASADLVLPVYIRPSEAELALKQRTL